MKNWTEHKREMDISNRNEWLVALTIGIIGALALILLL